MQVKVKAYYLKRFLFLILTKIDLVKFTLKYHCKKVTSCLQKPVLQRFGLFFSQYCIFVNYLVIFVK